MGGVGLLAHLSGYVLCFLFIIMLQTYESSGPRAVFLKAFYRLSLQMAEVLLMAVF